jgi:hypothetical protein
VLCLSLFPPCIRFCHRRSPLCPRRFPAMGRLPSVGIGSTRALEACARQT